MWSIFASTHGGVQPSVSSLGELDPGAADVLVGVVDVDVAGAVLVGDARDRARQRRVLGQGDHPDDLARTDVRPDLDREAGVALEALLRSHGGEAYLAPLLPSRPMSPATVTPVRKPRAGDPGGDLDAPWRVIVLNDDHNTFDGVAFALSSVLPGVGFDQGMKMANRIHSSGRAVVWSGHKERAELYWEQLRDLGLTMAPLDRL